MLVHRCQGFFALTVFGIFLAGPVKSSIGFSFFCCPCICSACPSAGLVVHQSVWHSVCPSTYSAGCSSCCSFWCPFCSSVNLVICRSILLPAGCNFVHLPVLQARCQSVFSSVNLAVKISFICLIYR